LDYNTQYHTSSERHPTRRSSDSAHSIDTTVCYCLPWVPFSSHAILLPNYNGPTTLSLIQPAVSTCGFGFCEPARRYLKGSNAFSWRRMGLCGDLRINNKDQSVSLEAGFAVSAKSTIPSDKDAPLRRVCSYPESLAPRQHRLIFSRMTHD
jgi:hypothetical protein